MLNRQLCNISLAILSFYLLAGLQSRADVRSDHRNNVLAEKVTSVAFAPRERRGLYKFQILLNGIVQKVDNKGVVKRLGQAEPSLIGEIKFLIHNINPNNTVIIFRPTCRDAPITTTYVYEGSRQIIIKKRMCHDYFTADQTAHQLAVLIDDLEKKYSRLPMD